MAIYDEFGTEMDEIDFELADGYYDEWGDYHKKTGDEMFDFDEDDDVDPDDDEELDTILINEINEDTMENFGFGDSDESDDNYDSDYRIESEYDSFGFDEYDADSDYEEE